MGIGDRRRESRSSRRIRGERDEHAEPEEDRPRRSSRRERDKERPSDVRGSDSRRSRRVESSRDDERRTSRRESSRRDEPERHPGRESGRFRRDGDDARESGRYSSRRGSALGDKQKMMYIGGGVGALVLVIIAIVVLSSGNDSDARRAAHRRAVDSIQRGSAQIEPRSSSSGIRGGTTRTPFSGDAFAEGHKKGAYWIGVVRTRQGNPDENQIRLTAENMTSDYMMSKAQEAKFVEGFVAGASQK